MILFYDRKNSRSGNLQILKGKMLWLPIVSVLLVIAFLYYMTVFVVIDGWLDLETSSGLFNVLIFTASVFMAILNFSISILKDPGYTSVSMLLDTEFPGDSSDIKKSQTRFCEKCFLYKPARAHHCHVCQRCILRMDHHCIWMNNCVGNGNYKVFFAFLLNSVISCIHSMVLLVGRTIQGVPEYKSVIASSYGISYIMFCLLLVLSTLALTTLLGWHIYLILHNMTTIEYREGVRAKWFARKSGNVYQHPYDLGIYENLTSVLGPNFFFWLCPSANHIGSGLRFGTSRKL